MMNTPRWKKVYETDRMKVGINSKKKMKLSRNEKQWVVLLNQLQIDKQQGK